MKIRKGDSVFIVSGKERGKRGKILKTFPKQERVVIEGINLRKKHLRARRAGEKGQIVENPAPIFISNVKLICSKCGKATRIGYKVTNKGKYRFCKKCGQQI